MKQMGVVAVVMAVGACGSHSAEHSQAQSTTRSVARAHTTRAARTPQAAATAAVCSMLRTDIRRVNQDGASLSDPSADSTLREIALIDVAKEQQAAAALRDGASSQDRAKLADTQSYVLGQVKEAFKHAPLPLIAFQPVPNPSLTECSR